jgi:glycosyltransferase involved in cell wall biosynthesis
VGPIGAKRHVVTIHDVFSIEFPHWVGKRFHLLYSFLLPRVASSSCHIVTVSEYSKDRIVENLNVPEDKVSVVYPGVDSSFVNAKRSEIERVRSKYRLPEDFVLTLGSLEPRKNLERVVDAWLQLDTEIRPPLVIAGGLGVSRVFGSYDVNNLRRHQDIRLLGYVLEEDLASLYSAATVFVYASLLEGFGLPPLEAMACGADVVVSNTSAMKETSKKMAFLVDPSSAESIAGGVTLALQVGRNSADRDYRSQLIRQRFNWSDTTKQVGSILQRYEQ